MSVQGIKAGSAFVALFADDSALKDTLNRWQGKLASWGAGITSAGTIALAAGSAALAPLAAATYQFAQSGSQIDDIANRTGASAEALSTMRYAADRTGTSIEAVTKGLLKSQLAIQGAADGGKAQIAALAELGIKYEDLKNRSPEDQFREILSAVGEINDPVRRTAAAVGIFGKSGSELIPLAKEFEDLEDRARDLNIAMSGEDVAAAATLGDALDDLRAVSQGLTDAIGAALAPTFTDLTLAVVEGTGQIIGWIKENRETIKYAAMVAATIAGVGIVLVTVGGILTGASLVIGGVTTAITFLTAAWATMGTVATATIAAIGSPIGVVIGVTTLLLTLWANLTESGRTVSNAIGTAFRELFGIVRDTLGGIAAALMKGDLALARDIFWAGMELAWAHGTGTLNTWWKSFLANMVGETENALGAIADAWNWVTGDNWEVNFAEAWAKEADDAADAMIESVGTARKKLDDLLAIAHADKSIEERAKSLPDLSENSPAGKAAKAAKHASGDAFMAASSAEAAKAFISIFQPKTDKTVSAIDKTTTAVKEGNEELSAIRDLMEDIDIGDFED